MSTGIDGYLLAKLRVCCLSLQLHTLRHNSQQSFVYIASWMRSFRKHTFTMYMYMYDEKERGQHIPS